MAELEAARLPHLCRVHSVGDFYEAEYIRKWVDIAHYLGCIDIRCNMRGGLPNWREDKDLVSRAAESFAAAAW